MAAPRNRIYLGDGETKNHSSQNKIMRKKKSISTKQEEDQINSRMNPASSTGFNKNLSMNDYESKLSSYRTPNKNFKNESRSLSMISCLKSKLKNFNQNILFKFRESVGINSNERLTKSYYDIAKHKQPEEKNKNYLSRSCKKIKNDFNIASRTNIANPKNKRLVNPSPEIQVKNNQLIVLFKKDHECKIDSLQKEIKPLTQENDIFLKQQKHKLILCKNIMIHSLNPLNSSLKKKSLKNLSLESADSIQIKGRFTMKSLDNKIEELYQKIREDNIKINYLNEDIKLLNNHKESLNTKLKSVVNEIKEIRTRVRLETTGFLKQFSIEFSKSINLFLSRTKMLTEESANLKKENAILKEKLDKIIKEKNVLLTDENSKKNHELEMQKTDLENRVSSLMDKLNKESKISDNRNQNLKNELNDAQQKLKVQSEFSIQLETPNEKLLKEIDNPQAKNLDLIKRFGQLESLNSNNLKENLLLKKPVDENKDKAIQTEILLDEKKTYEERYKLLKDTNSKLRKDIEDAKIHLKKQTSQIKELNEKKEELLFILQKSETKIKENEEKISEFHKYKIDNQKLLSDTKSELIDISKENKTLKNEINILNTELNHIKAGLKSSNEENIFLKSEVTRLNQSIFSVENSRDKDKKQTQALEQKRKTGSQLPEQIDSDKTELLNYIQDKLDSEIKKNAIFTENNSKISILLSEKEAELIKIKNSLNEEIKQLKISLHQKTEILQSLSSQQRDPTFKRLLEGILLNIEKFSHSEYIQRLELENQRLKSETFLKTSPDINLELLKKYSSENLQIKNKIASMILFK